jgi:Sulfotransferase family
MMRMLDQAEHALCGKQLVFLVGAPRSGTTWLQLLLSRSPFVVTAQETNLFNNFLRPMVSEWNHRRMTGVPRSLSELLSDEDFRVFLRGVSGFVFAKIAQAKPSATTVLEKTPNHVKCWREILELWPDAHFIHIIRDPRSVVASLRHASKTWGPDWGTSRISTISERWVSDVSDGRQIRSATHNYQEITYQELVSDGSVVLMRILGRLGVQSSLDECQRYVDECSIENLKAAKLNGAPFDLARIGQYRFRKGTTDSWRTELSTWEVAIVERLAGPLMLELGFQPVKRSGIMSALLDLDRIVKGTRRAARRRLQSLAERL